MPHPDAVEWNARYQSDPRHSVSKAARALLTEHIDLLPASGLAIDMACGTAATGQHLAARGWRVIGLDVAENALRLAQIEARRQALPISFAVIDLNDLWLPDSHVDVILNFYFLLRPLWTLYKKALRPGGFIFFETFVWQPGGELKPEHYLQPDELRQAFIDWDILHYKEVNQPLATHRARRIAQLVARKPLSTESGF